MHIFFVKVVMLFDGHDITPVITFGKKKIIDLAFQIKLIILKRHMLSFYE